MKGTELFSFDKIRYTQKELGAKIRTLLNKMHFHSVASEGLEVPSIMVYYIDDVAIHTGKKLEALGLQIAAGVPLKCNQPEEYKAFRIGLSILIN
jgi:aspartate aminotransferase-like enzyme